MLSYLLFVVSLVNYSGFENSGFENKNVKTELTDRGGIVTGGLIVKMGPVMNIRVVDVRVMPGEGELPVIAQKGSLFEGFSHNRLYAIRYGK
jgi:hypothetical protein